MRAIALTVAITIVSAFSGAHAASRPASGDEGRWCVIKSDDTRHCEFKRHRDCMLAISDGSGVCVPNEKTRGEMLDK